MMPCDWLRSLRSLFRASPRPRRRPIRGHAAACERLEERVLLCGPVPNAAPQLVNVDFATVEDNRGYGYVKGFLKGEIADDTRYGSYRILADENGDGSPDSWAAFSGDATTFAFAVSQNAPAGTVTL